MWDTLVGICRAIVQTVTDAIKSIVKNPESVTILTLSAVGLTAVVSELPFTISLPLAIEAVIAAPMVIPVLSIMSIAGLCMFMKWRLQIDV